MAPKSKITMGVIIDSMTRVRKRFTALSAVHAVTISTVICFLILLPCLSSAATGPASYRGSHIAVSMRVMAERYSFERNSLGGITLMEGFVLDRENQDVIIIGQRSYKHPKYHLDDLVVNMRTIWNKKEALYCSLDPRPEDVRQAVQILSENGEAASPDDRLDAIRQVKGIWGGQTVRIGGIPRRSRHAHIMIDADYHMKKVSLDLIKLSGITSYLERTEQRGEQNLRQGASAPGTEIAINRFWFHIKEGYPTFREANDIIWLEGSPVDLLTAKQNATKSGELYDADEDDPQAVAFADNFSAQFERVAKTVPSYASLQNLYRLRSLLQVMYNMRADKVSGLDMKFYLKKYRYQKDRAMPDKLPGLVNHKETYVEDDDATKWSFPLMYGGVNMEMDITEEQFRRDPKLKEVMEAAISVRPTKDALTWTFKLK